MNFASGIKEILDITLPRQNKTVKQLVGEYIEYFSKNKKIIMQGKVPKDPIQLAISYICSRSGRWVPVFEKADTQLRKRKIMSLLKKRELKSFLNDVYGQRGRGYKGAERKILQFLKALEGLSKELKLWSESERLKRFKDKLEEILEEKAKIGKKGIDNLLRDCGFFDRVPIDIHEQRFLLRTGIFHKYALRKKSDPTDHNHLADAMKNFCNEQLAELEINGISLSDSPGIVDLIIWYFSQEKTEKEISLGICAKIPQCEKCPLRNACLFSKLHAGAEVSNERGYWTE